jgi:hypothetical protein
LGACAVQNRAQVFFTHRLERVRTDYFAVCGYANENHMRDLDGLLSLYPNPTVKFYQQKFSAAPKSLESL